MAWTPEQRAIASAKAKANLAKRERDSAGQLISAKSQSKSARSKRRNRGIRGLVGLPGNPGADAGRTRRALNLSTMRELQAAFDRGGRKAIDQVMRTQPAMFLKMLVLLVPRELEVTHSAGVKGMSDEQIEQAIEAIKTMLAAREAKTIDVTPAKRQRRKALPSPLPTDDSKPLSR